MLPYNSKDNISKLMFNKNVAVSIGIVAIISISYAAFYQYQNRYSLYHHLDDYGFDTVAKKKELESLLREALHDPQLSLANKFPPRANVDELTADIVAFLKLTQDKFVIRSGHQERWEVATPLWSQDNIEENCASLSTLGFIEAIAPSQVWADAVVLFGATKPTMQKRMDYLASLDNQTLQFSNLILLAGERYVKINVDDTVGNLTAIAEKHHISLDKMTETILLQEIYLNSPLNNRKINPIAIDTPKGDLHRPTTQTTLIELRNWLADHPNIKNLVLVSSQPYVQYQKAIVSSILSSADNLQFEVIGSEHVCTEDIKSPIEALGAFIFAKTPEVLLQLGEHITDLDSIAQLQGLYIKQPLIYKQLDTIFVASDPVSDGIIALEDGA